MLREINNDAKGIVEFPLTSEEINVLRDIYSKFVVELKTEDVSRPEALSTIIGINPKVSPFWVLEKFINIDEFQIIKDGDMIIFVFDEDEEVPSSNNDKGGEKMEYNIDELDCCDALKKELKTVAKNIKKDFTNKMTSGEEKVAKAVIDRFANGFKIKNPSRMVFESCLKTAFPRIKNEKAATTNLINKGWLKETDGKIFIGPKGKEYLSP